MSTLQGSMYFLERLSLYNTEKPYELRYTPAPDQPKTNMKLEKADCLTMTNIRGREDDFSFRNNGFALVHLDSKMRPEDFEVRSKVIKQYLPIVADTVKEILGAQRVQIFDYVVSDSYCHIFWDS